MKILISGFEPFGEHKINPSQKLVEAMIDENCPGISLGGVILPVDTIAAPGILLQHLHREQPDAVLSFGLASGRAKISLERVAVNIMDFQQPDNKGITRSDTAVIENGPTAYFSTLPLRKIFSALKQAGIPVELSLTAGSYLCNQIFYTLMHEVSSQNHQISAGFIHLPALPEQAAQSKQSLPSLNFTQVLQSADIIINTLQQRYQLSQLQRKANHESNR